MFLRKLSSGLLLATMGVATASAQAPTTTTTRTTAITQDEIVLEGDATPRPALPTIEGDTGFWFVPTAETMPSGKFSFSAFRSNFDRRQGLTDVNQIGVTGAIAFGQVELFGSWRTVRLDRDVRPTFVPDQGAFGGVSQEYPYMRRSFSKTLGGPVIAGLKWGMLSQSRGDAMSLAPRVVVKFPSGSTWASTNDWDSHFDLVASREFARQFELSGTAGGVLRGDPDEFRVSDGITWGVGASFPSRSKLRALVEWEGEFVINKETLVLSPPYTAEDGSVAPILSKISDPADFKAGLVYQATAGWFVHGGMNYSAGTGDQTINGRSVSHTGWGFDLRLGWHPGVVPPRQRVRQIKETTTITNTVTPPPPAAAPRVNRAPDLGLGVTCNPCVVEVGRPSQLTATATDPDGDAVTIAWTAAQGNLSANTGPNVTWTAPTQPGNVTVTAVATDTGGAKATASTTLQVIRRTEIVFEDVHFDFDRFNLRPDALKILDDAVAKLQANPDIQVTLEGHCDSIGSQQYNLALGERRASSARDYLVSRGIAASRLRTVSFGEDRPAADNNTAQGRAENRRAHLVVVMTQ